MKNWHSFILGILATVFGSIVVAFILQYSIMVTSTSSSYVDINQAMPHYEFSTAAIQYMDYLNVVYKITPPLYLLGFNSKIAVKLPEGYSILSKATDYWDGCAGWTKETTDSLALYVSQNKLKFPECSLTIKFAKLIPQEELAKVVFNSSWRKDSDGVRSYEEEGVSIISKLNKPVKNYIFVYNQTNNSQILKKFSECAEVKVFLDQSEHPFSKNFFQNASVIAAKMDLEPFKARELVVRCYH